MSPYYEDAESGITIYHGDCREIDLTVPLDREHDEATVLREQIRAWFDEAHRRVAVWTPREMPR